MANKSYDYVFKFSADEGSLKEIEKAVLQTFKKAQTAIKEDSLVVDIKADEDTLVKQIEQIFKKRPELGEKLKIQFDTQQITNIERQLEDATKRAEELQNILKKVKNLPAMQKELESTFIDIDKKADFPPEKELNALAKKVQTYKKLGGTLSRKIEQGYATLDGWATNFVPLKEIESIDLKEITSQAEEAEKQVFELQNTLQQLKSSSSGGTGGTGEGTGADGVEAAVTPKVDPAAFIAEIQSSLDQSGKSVEVAVAPKIDTDFKKEVSTAASDKEKADNNPETLSKGSGALNDLKNDLDSVVSKINEKTEAFKNEENVVTPIIQSEITTLGSLSNALTEISNQITGLSEKITSLPSLSQKFNSTDSNLDASNITNFIKKVSDLDLPSIKSNVEELQIIINNLKELSDKEISFEKIKISDLTRRLNDDQLKKLKSIGKTLKKFSDDTKDFVVPSFDSDSFSGLKITKANVSNMEKMADAIGKIHEQLEKFDANATSVFNTIEKLTSNSEALKDLNNIIKNTDKAEKTVKKSQESEQLKKDAQDAKEAESAYKKLSRAARTYYESINKKSMVGEDGLNSNQRTKISEYEELKQDADSYTGSAERAIKAREEFNRIEGNAKQAVQDSYIGSISQTITQLNQNTGNYTSEYLDKLKEASSILENLRTFNFFDDDLDTVNKLKKELNSLLDDLKDSRKYKIVDPSDRNSLANEILDYRNANSIVNREYGEQLDLIAEKLKKIKTYDELDELRDEFEEIRISAKAAGLTGLSVFDQWKYKMKSLFTYLASFASFYDIINTVQRAFTTIESIDESLTEMRKVSDSSLSSLKEYQKESFNTADAIGSTAKSLQDSIYSTYCRYSYQDKH